MSLTMQDRDIVAMEH